jgi:hypothetical protein
MTDIVTTPTKESQYGRSWAVDIAAVAEASKLGSGATIGCWIVEARWAHPLWHSYYFTLIHLRPVSDCPDPVVALPGATHEFGVFAMNPEIDREPQLRDRRAALLHPVNFAAQLIEPSDDAAIARIEDAIDRVIRGLLNPDTDALQSWIALFGDSLIRPEYRGQ